MNNSSTLLDNFKSLVNDLHALLNLIEVEVIKTIDSRDPNQVSSTQTVRSPETLVSACRRFGQLSDNLATYAVGPSDHVTTIAGGFHESNALQVASELHVADALGTEEMSLTALASKVNADAVRLRQCMRLLVNRRVFRETSFGSDIFANNRMSSILLSAHENNVNAFIGHWCEDAYLAGVSIVQSVRADTAHKAAFDIQYGQPIWEYYLTPEGAAARDRLNKAMIAAEPLLHGSLIYQYDWTKFGEDFTMIDVGGGFGGAAIEFTRRFSKMNVIIQDKPSVLVDAPKFWDKHAPECKSRVTFMEHDFFTPQPKIDTTGFRIYFMRMVLHDWKADDCVRILEPIAVAMKEQSGSSSRLYIADAIVDAESDRFKHMVSMQMMTLAGAEERTENQFRDVIGRAGLKIESIWRNPGFTALIECTPV